MLELCQEEGHLVAEVEEALCERERRRLEHVPTWHHPCTTSDITFKYPQLCIQNNRCQWQDIQESCTGDIRRGPPVTGWGSWQRQLEQRCTCSIRQLLTFNSSTIDTTEEGLPV